MYVGWVKRNFSLLLRIIEQKAEAYDVLMTGSILYISNFMVNAVCAATFTASMWEPRHIIP